MLKSIPGVARASDRSRELYASAIMLMRITKITRRLRDCTERVLDIFFERFFVFVLYAATLHDVSSLEPTPVRIKIYAGLPGGTSSLHNHAVNERERANHAKKESVEKNLWRYVLG